MKETSFDLNRSIGYVYNIITNLTIPRFKISDTEYKSIVIYRGNRIHNNVLVVVLMFVTIIASVGIPGIGIVIGIVLWMIYYYTRKRLTIIITLYRINANKTKVKIFASRKIYHEFLSRLSSHIKSFDDNYYSDEGEDESIYEEYVEQDTLNTGRDQRYEEQLRCINCGKIIHQIQYDRFGKCCDVVCRDLSTKRDCYEILGVSKRSTTNEIKKKYHKLVLEFHPDRNKSSNAAKYFKEISEAYEILSNTKKRRIYDQSGYAGVYDMDGYR